MVNHVYIKEGLNVIVNQHHEVLHVYVRDGLVQDISLFNARVTNKKTHTCQMDNEKLHYVTMNVKYDSGNWGRKTEEE